MQIVACAEQIQVLLSWKYLEFFSDIFPSNKSQMHLDFYTFIDKKPGTCSETGSIQIEIFNSCPQAVLLIPVSLRVGFLSMKACSL